MGNLVTFRGSHLREPIGVSASSRRGPPLRYLSLIALAAFIGDLAHIAVDPRSQIPCIGASGGSAGAITFYALNFPRVRLEVLMRWGFVWFRWIRLPAWSVFLLWIFFQLIGAWEQRPA